ncbi:hypothetical protein Ancab_021421 [Ancistrocladus abbreviatus]
MEVSMAFCISHLRSSDLDLNDCLRKTPMVIWVSSYGWYAILLLSWCCFLPLLASQKPLAYGWSINDVQVEAILEASSPR